MENTEENINLKPEEKLEALHVNNLKLIQKKGLFSFGIDAVLLADFAKLTKKDVCIDLGCGNGIIPLLLTAQSSCQKITGIEIQSESAELALRNVKLNSLEDRIKIINGDIKKISEYFEPNRATAVVSNPPYFNTKDSKEKNQSEKLTASRHEEECSLEDVIKAASYLLNSSGCFYLIHRPERLAEIFTLLKACSLEPKEMRLVQSFKNTEPKLVLIKSVKSAKPGLKIMSGLTVYESAGVYTEELNRIYRRPNPLI